MAEHESIEIVLRSQLNGQGGLFALQDRAEYVDQIVNALGAKTWGEFRDLLPFDEFWSLPMWDEFIYYDADNELFFAEDHLLEDLFIENQGSPDRYLINSVDPFPLEPGTMGYEEGEYPPHLETEQYFLPLDFCKKYGTHYSWWTFPLDKIIEMKTDLESRGFTVIDQSSTGTSEAPPMSLTANTPAPLPATSEPIWKCRLVTYRRYTEQEAKAEAAKRRLPERSLIGDLERTYYPFLANIVTFRAIQNALRQIIPTGQQRTPDVEVEAEGGSSAAAPRGLPGLGVGPATKDGAVLPRRATKPGC